MGAFSKLASAITAIRSFRKTLSAPDMIGTEILPSILSLDDFISAADDHITYQDIINTIVEFENVSYATEYDYYKFAAAMNLISKIDRTAIEALDSDIDVRIRPQWLLFRIEEFYKILDAIPN